MNSIFSPNDSNPVKLGRAVTLMKYLASVVSFPAGTRHLQDILRLSWNCLVSIRHFQDIYKTSSCRLLARDISKIS